MEIRHMHLSSEKAIARLGWNARFGFDEGLKRTVAWYERHFTRGPISAFSSRSGACLNILMSALVDMQFEAIVGM
jgi:hypothetical protein